MFKKFKETRENKRLLLQYKVLLLGELSNLILEYKNAKDSANKADISDEDALELVKKLKGADQKQILSVLVDAIKKTDGK